MRVLLAKHSGFCFGVSRAIELVYRAAENDARVCTFGKIIHNEGVVRELEDCGIFAVESVDDLRAGDTLVIRAHGAPPEHHALSGNRTIPLLFFSLLRKNQSLADALFPRW